MKQSVYMVVASTLAIILCLAIAITFFSILSLSSSLHDASFINVTGSLRMQVYRLAYDMQNQKETMPRNIFLFEQSLGQIEKKIYQDDELQKIDDIHGDFSILLIYWQTIKTQLSSATPLSYHYLDDFVLKIDKFVLQSQKHVEQKIVDLAVIGVSGLLIILLLIIFLIHYTQNRIVLPLNQLVNASKKIQQGDFDIHLSLKHKNELSLLCRHFILMANELKALYFQQETRITNKTQTLVKANRTLQILYQCSTELSSSKINKDNFFRMLEHVLNDDGITALRLTQRHPNIAHWEIKVGIKNEEPWHCINLSLDKIKLGELFWQGDETKVDSELLIRISKIFARGIYYLHAQKQELHIAVMEERSSLARELHDSIAQSLSYLKIQLTLLKRTMGKQNNFTANDILESISTQLNLAYDQLRTLISVFRLSSIHDDFTFALNEMLENLRNQSDLTIHLDEKNFPLLQLDIHRMMHVLLIIREACTNTIKHGEADRIDIFCKKINEEVEIKIKDNGIGFVLNKYETDHFGLNIMKERTELLGGNIDIYSMPNQGCQITLTFSLVE